eukprot:7058311-Karenia_brevis.AAC.1
MGGQTNFDICVDEGVDSITQLIDQNREDESCDPIKWNIYIKNQYRRNVTDSDVASSSGSRGDYEGVTLASGWAHSSHFGKIQWMIDPPLAAFRIEFHLTPEYDLWMEQKPDGTSLTVPADVHADLYGDES